ncbi:MAG TPA: methylenetetrahydrofolate reductase C-terminal domain-containing protein [Armatimonadota bacterium]|jgi:hypothetical protein
MTATEKKVFDDILKALETRKSVFIVGCGDCATVVQTGGEFEATEMTEALTAAGKTVTGHVIPDAACKILDMKRLLRQNQEAVDAADAILVLACGAGVQAVSEVSTKPVVPGLDTIGQVDQFRLGQYYEWCSSCGECVLAEYGGICPITRCPKGQVHGPCGGANEGKCEVNPENPCVWSLIYERAEKLGEEPVAIGAAYHEPRDYRKAGRPRQKVFEPRRGG